MLGQGQDFDRLINVRQAGVTKRIRIVSNVTGELEDGRFPVHLRIGGRGGLNPVDVRGIYSAGPREAVLAETGTVSEPP